MSGLIMLMIQSIVGTLVACRPEASPAELVADVNRVLVGNLHHRLHREEHATFALLRLHDDGRVRFAGAHEELVVWRAKTRTFDRVETTGTWLGLMADIREVTVDQALTLFAGDLLVLYTDGIPEARNAHGEHFGVDAICRIVSAHAEAGPAIVHRELVAAVRTWAPVLQDDVTCVVARYCGTPGEPTSPAKGARADA
jgi:serine phosphatase RsbU (regulator of sigma subunit)